MTHNGLQSVIRNFNLNVETSCYNGRYAQNDRNLELATGFIC